jgi:hypothetical protein
MIKDLMKLKNQIDSMIETYKDLHPDDDIHYDLMDNGEYITKEEYETHDKGNNTHLDGMSEYNQKEQALKKIREGSYENKFSESKRKKVAGQSQGHPTLCVYGDT